MSIPSKESAGITCYVASYDHGGLVLWGYDHFLQHLRGLLGWLDRHPKLKMGLDNEAWTYDWLAENQPAVLEEMRQALDKYSGRLGIATCTYGQPLSAFVVDESNIRQIALGIDATREHLGYEIEVYSFSEHAAFAQLPQILVGFGIENALLRTHFMMYGYCPGYDVPIAWWQGPDGSRVACVPAYKQEERQVADHRAQPPGPFGLTTEDTWILTRYPSAESPLPLDHFAARFSRIRPCLATRLDDSGLKREALVSELDGRDDYRWATLEDIFNEFPEPEVTIAPTSEDFGTRMPWGYRANEIFDLTRRAEVRALIAERLLARAALAGERSARLTPDQRRRLESDVLQAWKDVLVAQHHDVQIVAPTISFGRERLHASLQGSSRVIRDALESQVGGHSDPHDFTVFNPLPWPRTEATAELPDGTLLHGAFPAPALGFAPIRPVVTVEQKPAELSFETGAYRVRVHPEGGISELTTRDGRQILRQGAVSGRLAGVIDGTPYEGSGKASVVETMEGYQVTDKGSIGPLSYGVDWFFPSNGERIELSITARFNGERIGELAKDSRDSRSCFTHEKKLRIRLFPALDAAKAVGLFDVPFGFSTTARPYVEGNYWTALADGSGGLAIANRGTMGSVRENDGAFSVPLVFTTPYVWGADIVSGPRQWSMALLPFAGDWRGAGIHRRALEFAFPMVAVPGAPARQCPDFLRIGNPDIHLTALYIDHGSTYARFFNGSDKEQKLTVKSLSDFAVTPVDLRHRELHSATPLALRPWQVLTLRLG